MAFAARARAPAAAASASRPNAASRLSAVRPMALFGGKKTATAGAESPFYSFKLKDIDGKPFDMKQLKGKVVLVVHTATACGLTPQFAVRKRENERERERDRDEGASGRRREQAPFEPHVCRETRPPPPEDSRHTTRKCAHHSHTSPQGNNTKKRTTKNTKKQHQHEK
jgi:hypothetical protein